MSIRGLWTPREWIREPTTNYRRQQAAKRSSTGGGSYSYTFDYTGSVQTLTIPVGAINIQFAVKGAGGGAEEWTVLKPGEWRERASSHKVPYSTSGVTLDIYVGSGGAEGSIERLVHGGWGNQSGGAGGEGEFGGYRTIRDTTIGPTGAAEAVVQARYY